MSTTVKASSPRIMHVKWGHIEVEGADRSFKDVKVYPGGCRTWNWNETGTSHNPGIQLADVEELVEHGAEAVVLSKGMLKRLQVQQKTLDWLDERGIEYQVLPTEEAVEAYNKWADERPVGGLFHSTC